DRGPRTSRRSWLHACVRQSHRLSALSFGLRADSRWLTADGCQRQRESHDGTVARRALHGDGAAMSVEDGPGDGQAQPAALAGAIGIPAAVEALKDVWRLLGRDAGPLVADLCHGVISGDVEARAHRAAARRELEG